jgi:hypothetical protein
MNDVSTGQPLWYYALSPASRLETLRDRAKAAGAEYVMDGSRIGLLPNGEPDPAAMRAADEAAKARRTGKNPRLAAKRR